MEIIKVKVPATSANIGAGFDCLGMAVSIYNEYTFEKASDFFITGCPDEYANKNNLVYTSFKKAFEVCGKESPMVHIHINADIPVSRGLGSSAACIVGGVLAANSFMGNCMSEDEVFKLCTELEGHPDNVAPAIFGGLQACFVEEDAVYHNEFSIHDSYYFTALIPPFPLSTAESRSVLPKAIERKDAVYNMSHAVATLRYLENGNYDLLTVALRDCLHQPYRFPLIKDANKVVEICEKYGGKIVYLSGAGPTLMCVSKEDITKTLASNINLGWDIRGVEVVDFGAIKGVEIYG